MSVGLIGKPVTLWCIARGSTTAFKVTAGTDNDLSDLRELIKNKKPNDFANVDPDNLILWHVNVDQNVINTINDMLNNNNKLLISANTIGVTFQGLGGTNIRVVVGVPIIEQPAVAKRTREDSIISTEGPLHPYENALMLPVDTRDIFKEVKSGIYGGKSYIIHGPYQSGKTTFLLELKETIRDRNSNLKYFQMSEIKGETLTNKREGFFKFISFRIFREILTETETIDKISELENPYYVLIDEFQYIFTDEELLNVTKDFFRDISSSKVRYVAVGTFILVDLLKDDDGELISPFNKASFKLMDLFDIGEMGEIFKQYKLNLNASGVPPSFAAEIMRVLRSPGVFHDFVKALS